MVLGRRRPERRARGRRALGAAVEVGAPARHDSHDSHGHPNIGGVHHEKWGFYIEIVGFDQKKLGFDHGKKWFSV